MEVEFHNGRLRYFEIDGIERQSIKVTRAGSLPRGRGGDRTLAAAGRIAEARRTTFPGLPLRSAPRAHVPSTRAEGAI